MAFSAEQQLIIIRPFITLSIVHVEHRVTALGYCNLKLDCDCCDQHAAGQLTRL